MVLLIGCCGTFCAVLNTIDSDQNVDLLVHRSFMLLGGGYTGLKIDIAGVASQRPQVG